MESTISTTARQIATYWAQGHQRSACVIRGYARQVQDHLDHQADPEHLRRLAWWMSADKPACLDLDLALHYRDAPRPEVPARSGHPCLCRGGSTQRGGAPAPALVRQLIRKPAHHARAA